MGPPLHDFCLFRLCTRRRGLRKAQSGIACVHPVQEGRLLWRTEEIPSDGFETRLRKPDSGRRRYETGFRRGFSQLTFATMRAQYERSGFPTQP